MKRETKPRRFGLPHAFAFPIVRWFGDKTPADRADHDQHLLPAELDQPAPRLRARPGRPQGGRRVGHATRRSPSRRSGGLSHFVVDEELDRIALKGLTEANGEILSTLPRHRLQSATTETLNWVAIAGAMGSTHDGDHHLRARLPHPGRHRLRLRRRSLALGFTPAQPLLSAGQRGN